MSNIQDTNIIPELQSPFEQLREIDADGKTLHASGEPVQPAPPRKLSSCRHLLLIDRKSVV